MGVTVSSIISEFGAYYRDAGQNKNRILKMLNQDTVTTGIMTPIKTDDTIYEFSKGVIGKVLQPFQKAWTPKGTLVFTPNSIYQKHMKIDIEVDPDDLEASWLGFLASSDLTRKDWPLVRYMVEEYVFPQMREDFELDVVFNGKAKAVTPNVAGEPADIMNGLGELIRLGVAAGSMNLINTGALNADTIFDQIEMFTKSIAPKYRNIPMEINASPSWVRAYQEDKRAQGFYTIKGPEEIDVNIDFTPFKLRGLPSMEESNVLFCTPKQNMIHLMKKTINQNRVNIEESKRQVFIMTDYWEGIGFGINEIVWTNYGTGSDSD